MTKFSIKLLAGLSSAILAGSVSQPLLAQSLFGSDWPISAFAALSFIRADDQRELYRSEVFLEVAGNQLNVYSTFKQDPFGSLARCGGLGCDLGQGDLVASLTFTPVGDGILSVNAATGSAQFMQGARCQLDRAVEPYLTCYAARGPGSINFPSIIQFTIGT